MDNKCNTLVAAVVVVEAAADIEAADIEAVAPSGNTPRNNNIPAVVAEAAPVISAEAEEVAVKAEEPLCTDNKDNNTAFAEEVVAAAAAAVHRWRANSTGSSPLVDNRCL